ncbi:MAG: Bug family tripartite tricarboxylate transporter substrate binding protein [Burkholderiaceae bacterium]
MDPFEALAKRRLSRRQFASIAGVLAASTRLPALAADASGWPARTIRLVIGFPPGTLPDVMGRVVAEKMARGLGQSIIVDNKSGAAGSLAASEVARAAPDGYTIMVGVASNLAVAPYVMRSANYDPAKSFAAIGIIQRSPYFIVARPDLPVSNLRELLAYARSQPGKLNYATPGVATLHHLTWELLSQRAGISMTHVPMQGPQMITEMLGGRVDLFMDSATSIVTSNVKSGKFKFIAMTGSTRMAALPDVPTAGEQGVTGVESHAFNGMLAPAGTPREILLRLNAELNKALTAPDTMERLKAEGVPVEQGVTSTPEGFASLVASEYVRWGRVIKDANISMLG